MFGFKKKRKVPKTPEGTRYYGGTGTIHSNGSVDVEVDSEGKVVAVWFRCQPLEFKGWVVNEARAKEMRRLYESPGLPIEAIVLKEPEVKYEER